jgi:hypothetical protein
MTQAEFVKTVARFQDLVAKMLRRPLTAEEDAEMLALETALDSI